MVAVVLIEIFFHELFNDVSLTQEKLITDHKNNETFFVNKTEYK